MDYRGKVAIVTGASSGIGRELAIDFAKRGTKTIVVSRRAERLNDTLAAMRALVPECEAIVGDVGDRATASAAVGMARERFGRLDFLVNNAGISKRKHLLDVTADDAEETIRVNLLGPIFFILEALPMMTAQGAGTIVNVSSIVGRMPNPRESIYSASKFGLCGLSEAMYFDLHRRGIHTLLVIPGPIATEIWDKLESPPSYKGKFYPASDVSKATFAAIEKRRHVVTIPRHMGAIAALRGLFPALLRRGLDSFDPDRPAKPRG